MGDARNVVLGLLDQVETLNVWRVHQGPFQVKQDQFIARSAQLEHFLDLQWG